MNPWLRLGLVWYLIVFSHLCSWAQNFSNGFLFYLPPQDTTWQPFLPYFPSHAIEDDAFVGIDADGHFRVKDQRMRFWGVNITADGAFPSQDKAWFVAGRLRKMGFNLVRFHHIDNPWSSYSLFERNKDTRHLNPLMLDRLERLIFELKKNGIYINMNLHVSRTFRSQDGIADADSIQDFGKAVSFFDPQLLPLYKEYAQQLLTHVNPYTGLKLVQDPVMAMVEITNENSLYRWWRDGMLKPFSQGGRIMTRHAEMLDEQWHDFLSRRYGNTDALRQAWNQGISTSRGTELIRDSGFEKGQLGQNWQLEQHETAHAVMSLEPVLPFAGQFCARVIVTQSDGINWHIQWKQVGMTIKKDSLYTVRFAGRSDQPRIISVSIMRDTSPWTTYGSSSFQLLPQWQEFTFSLRAPETCDRLTRLSFHLGAQAGTFWFDEIHLTPATIIGLEPHESLEAQSVRRIDYGECVRYSDARVMDQSAFYLQVQDDFYAEMYRFLKNELGVKVAIVGTNWNVGPADMIVQDKLDYIDNHAYWDHPQFPHTPWSSTDWLINNTPMVLAKDGGAIATALCAVGSVGKPFTLSEYNHPFPNRYQSEAPLFLCGYGSFHDLDAVLFFDYGGSNNDFTTDFIDSYFAIHRNTALMALMPSCAQAFRSGWIAPAAQTLQLSYKRDDILLLPKFDSGDWRGPQLIDPRLALIHAVRNLNFDASSTTPAAGLPSPPESPYVSDTGQILWDDNGWLQITTDRFIAVAGQLPLFAGRIVGPLQILAASEFAALTWIAIDDAPLTRANRSLITLSSRVQNTGMIWDGTHTLHDHWGKAPTQMMPIKMQLRLEIQADSIRVFPLNTRGSVEVTGKTYFPIAKDKFHIELDQLLQKTVWFGIERYGDLTKVNDHPSASKRPQSYILQQNYPNPLLLQQGQTTAITVVATQPQELRVFIYDALGRLVRQFDWLAPIVGSQVVYWDGRDDHGKLVGCGVYFCHLVGDNPESAKTPLKKIVVLH